MTSELTVIRDDITIYVRSKCFFIPEEKFFTVEEFKSNAFEAIVRNMIHLAFVTNTQYDMIAIKAKYLKEDGEYRNGLHNFLSAYYDYLTTYTPGGRNHFIIIKKSKVDFLTENTMDINSAIDEMFFNIRLDEMKMKMLDDDQKESTPTTTINFSDITILLPQISSFSVKKLTEKSAAIIIDEINLESIYQKNSTRIPSFHKLFKDAKLTYSLYLYNGLNSFKEFSGKKIKTETKVKFNLGNLESNHLYLFKLGIVFNGEFYSPLKKSFYFYTKNHPTKERKLYAYGNNEHYELIDKSSQYFDTIKELPYNVTDFSLAEHQSLMVLSKEGQVINGGKFWYNKQGNDFFETESNTNKNIRLIYNLDPFSLTFPSDIYIRKVSIGKEHCIALSNLGQCFSWGANIFGQLGLSIEKSLIVGLPRRITFPKEEGEIFITDITSGSNHNLAFGTMQTKSVLFYWGFGIGIEKTQINTITGYNFTCSSSPIKLPFPHTDSIIKIIAGHNNSAIIIPTDKCFQNHVYTFGANYFSQLGFVNQMTDGQKIWNVPTLVDYFVENMLSVIDVSITEQYHLFIVYNSQKNRNEIYVTGYCEMIKKEVIKIPERIIPKIDGKVVYACGEDHAIYFLMDNGKISILDDINQERKELVIEGYKYRFEDSIKMQAMKDNFLLMIKG